MVSPAVTSSTAAVPGSGPAPPLAAPAVPLPNMKEPRAHPTSSPQAQVSMSFLFEFPCPKFEHSSSSSSSYDPFEQQEKSSVIGNVEGDEDGCSVDAESNSTFWDVLTSLYLPLLFLWFRRSTFGSLNLLRSLILGHCLRLVFTTTSSGGATSPAWTVQVPEWIQQYLFMWKTNKSSNPYQWPPPALTALAILTIFALVVHPDGLTWIMLRKIRDAMISLLHSSASCWAIVMQDYGILSTLAAVATFVVLALLIIVMHRTLSPSSPGKQKRPNTEKKKKKRKGHHARGRGGRIKSTRKPDAKTGSDLPSTPHSQNSPSRNISNNDNDGVSVDDSSSNSNNTISINANNNDNTTNNNSNNDDNANENLPDENLPDENLPDVDESSLQAESVLDTVQEPQLQPQPQPQPQPQLQLQPLQQQQLQEVDALQPKLSQLHSSHYQDNVTHTQEKFTEKKKYTPEKIVVKHSTLSNSPQMFLESNKESIPVRLPSVSTLDTSTMSDDLSCGSISVRSTHSMTSSKRPSDRNRKNKPRNSRNPRTNNRRGKKFNKDFANGTPTKSGPKEHVPSNTAPSRWDSLKPSHPGRYARRNNYNQARGPGGAATPGIGVHGRKVNIVSNAKHNRVSPCPASPASTQQYSPAPVSSDYHIAHSAHSAAPVSVASATSVPVTSATSIPAATAPVPATSTAPVAIITAVPVSVPPAPVMAAASVLTPVAAPAHIPASPARPNQATPLPPISPMTQSLFSCEVGASGWSPPPLPSSSDCTFSSVPNGNSPMQQPWSGTTPPPGLGGSTVDVSPRLSNCLPPSTWSGNSTSNCVQATPTLWESSQRKWDQPSLSSVKATIRSPPGLPPPNTTSFPPAQSGLTTMTTPKEDFTLFPQSSAAGGRLGGHSSIMENPFDQEEDCRIEAELQELGGRMVGSVLDF